MNRRQLLWVGLLLLLFVGCERTRCHTGHYVVRWEAAYTTHHSHCISYDKDGSCNTSIPYTVDHPPACYVTFNCDATCKDVDTGRLEAHTPHEPRRDYKASVADTRCWWDRQMKAWPR